MEVVYGVIYGIELLLDNRIYIGQSRDMRKRINAHKSGKTSFIDKAIQEYGWQNFVCVVLEECYSQDELDAAEKRWIIRLNAQSPNGYNFTNGGSKNYHFIKDICKKHSESIKGKKFTQEHRNNIAKAIKGIKHPLEFGLNLSIARKKFYTRTLNVNLNHKNFHILN